MGRVLGNYEGIMKYIGIVMWYKVGSGCCNFRKYGCGGSCRRGLFLEVIVFVRERLIFG